MNKEIWKNIPSYDDYYQVSSLGRVKGLERFVKNNHGVRIVKEKILKVSDDGNGYKYCHLSLGGKIKTFKVHKLVAMSFLSHKPDGNKLVIDHINNDKTDNRVENLQIITQRENSSKDKKGYTSNYIGVCRNKGVKTWRSQIIINGKTTYLGSFRNELEAHFAYQNKLQEVNQ